MGTLVTPTGEPRGAPAQGGGAPALGAGANNISPAGIPPVNASNSFNLLSAEWPLKVVQLISSLLSAGFVQQSFRPAMKNLRPRSKAPAQIVSIRLFNRRLILKPVKMCCRIFWIYHGKVLPQVMVNSFRMNEMGGLIANSPILSKLPGMDSRSSVGWDAWKVGGVAPGPWEQHAPMPRPSRGEAYIKHPWAFRHAFFSFPWLSLPGPAVPSETDFRARIGDVTRENAAVWPLLRYANPMDPDTSLQRIAAALERPTVYRRATSRASRGPIASS